MFGSGELIYSYLVNGELFVIMEVLMITVLELSAGSWDIMYIVNCQIKFEITY